MVSDEASTPLSLEADIESVSTHEEAQYQPTLSRSLSQCQTSMCFVRPTPWLDLKASPSNSELLALEEETSEAISDGGVGSLLICGVFLGRFSQTLTTTKLALH